MENSYLAIDGGIFREQSACWMIFTEKCRTSTRNLEEGKTWGGFEDLCDLLLMHAVPVRNFMVAAICFRYSSPLGELGLTKNKFKFPFGEIKDMLIDKANAKQTNVIIPETASSSNTVPKIKTKLS